LYFRKAPSADDVRLFSAEAQAFLVHLHQKFNARRLELLARRQERQRRLDAGELPDFRKDTAAIRESNWQVSAIPADLQDRRVEITGPVDRKMVINALNSGAKCFMADFEDASSPVWETMTDGQRNLQDALRRTIRHVDIQTGKTYTLKENPAVLLARPRGLHLDEAHVECAGERYSGSLFDFGLYLFHNVEALKALDSGAYYYLPKLEDVITEAERYQKLRQGFVKVTVLIETILATFEAEEILFALRPHIVALNCGRWDYIFSYIKKFARHPDRLLPDRQQVTMTVPFMRAYSQHIIHVCHKRGALAMGGMAAQIPVKDNPAANEAAMARVRADKEREASDGHDGTWVAHPALIPLAQEVFDRLMPAANQVDKKIASPVSSADDLLAVPAGSITEAGVRTNIQVGILYLAAWLDGQGCVPIHNLMEDAATAEICRAQCWQWRQHQAKLEDGRILSAGLLEQWIAEEHKSLKKAPMLSTLDRATAIFQQLCNSETFTEFLTLPAYDELIKSQ
jgi:malate synthase